MNRILIVKKHFGSSLLIVIASTMLLASISGCSKTEQIIKLGVVGTMTGINSDLSVSGRRGVEFAVNEINNSGGINGKKFELIIKDDKNNEQTALQVDKEFVSEQVKYVIGHYTSGMIVNSMNYLKDKPILFLAPTISADSLSGQDDNLIRFIATTKEQAIHLANLAIKRGDKRLGVVYDLRNKAFCEGLYGNFKNFIEKSGAKIVDVRTFTADVDENFGSIASKLRNAKLDSVFIIADAVHNAELTQQIRKQGSKLQIYSPLWSNTPDLFRKGGAAIDGMLIVGAIDQNDAAERFQTFQDQFYETYGEYPTFSSMYSYEATYALFEALKTGASEPEQVKAEILKIKNFKGLQSEYQIDRFGDNNRSYMIFEVSKGNLRKVEL